MTRLFTAHLEEDPETGELLLPFPPEALEKLGWSEGHREWNEDPFAD